MYLIPFLIELQFHSTAYPAIDQLTKHSGDGKSSLRVTIHSKTLVGLYSMPRSVHFKYWKILFTFTAPSDVGFSKVCDTILTS